MRSAPTTTAATLPRFHEMPHHVVGDERERHAAFVQFPRGEPRALQIRARLRHEHVQLVTLLDGHANHAQRRADARRGKRPGVALRHYLARGRHQFRAEPSNRFVRSSFFGVDRARFLDHRAAQRVERRLRGDQLFESPLHTLDGPEQVNGCRPVCDNRLADQRELGAKFFQPTAPFERSTPSATPIAAATPIAGAPRITMSLIAAATSR